MKAILLWAAAAVMLACGLSCSRNGDHGPPAMAEAPMHGEKDPVCGMMVDPKQAIATAMYKGKKYYFCSREDKGRFEKSPAQYITDGNTPP